MAVYVLQHIPQLTCETRQPFQLGFIQTRPRREETTFGLRFSRAIFWLRPPAIACYFIINGRKILEGIVAPLVNAPQNPPARA